MPTVPFDHYLCYQEISDILAQFESSFPGLVTISSIGKSYEGRDIWLATVTNHATGEPLHKPAFWVDGNIHASEVSACSAVMHLLQKVCSAYGKDERITRLLDTRTLYLVPRLNPDGAEWALETPPRVIRSSTRPYPYEEEDIEGLERQDLDGDGRILSIRIKDPNGPWKICEEEPRMLVRRGPIDEGGTYYRLLPEGLLHNWDGITIRPKRIQQGLDMNRNFPSGWRQEREQYGAGPYPTSEPEIRAAVQAICDRPNICGAVAFHTFSGVHLRPPSRCADDDIPSEDLWAFQKIGQVGTEMTGYPAISTYHEFRYHPKEVITGVFDDWMYEHRGVFPWITEIWSPQRQAGITDYKYIEWFREHPVEDDIKLLHWSDQKLGGLGHIDWKPFIHPQLGEVEIGGWDAHLAFRNPPIPFLEAEISPLGDWIIWQALCSPKLELRDVKVEPIGEALRICAVVQNVGWLPTNVTEKAKKNNLCRGVRAEISRTDEPLGGSGDKAPAWLHGGRIRQDGGQLAGRNHVSAGGFGWQFNDTSDLAVFEWVVSKGTYDVLIQHERAGTISTRIDSESYQIQA